MLQAQDEGLEAAQKPVLAAAITDAIASRKRLMTDGALLLTKRMAQLDLTSNSEAFV